MYQNEILKFYKSHCSFVCYNTPYGTRLL